jgi:hypothetical protein
MYRMEKAMMEFSVNGHAIKLLACHVMIWANVDPKSPLQRGFRLSW